MNDLEWTTHEFLQGRNYRIPVGRIDASTARFDIGLRTETKLRNRTDRVFRPLVRARDSLFIDGFVEWTIGSWIREHAHPDQNFLDIGCGDMSLHKYLPQNLWYNAFDISLSEFQLTRVLRKRARVNIALASVTNIPLEANVASLITSSQVLEYVSPVDQALNEIYRVSAPRAKLLVSIANGHCRKYRIKGSHPGHVNFWSRKEFAEIMVKHNFRLLRSTMRGYWIPMPPSLVRSSYELPIPCSDESLNSYLFFLFEAIK